MSKSLSTNLTLQLSQSTDVTLVIKNGHHMTTNNMKTIPRTFEARCSLLRFCMDLFPMVDSRLMVSSPPVMGFVLCSIWSFLITSSMLIFSGVDSTVCSLWKTVHTMGLLTCWHALDLRRYTFLRNTWIVSRYIIIMIMRGMKKAAREPYSLNSPKPSKVNRQVWLLLKVMLIPWFGLLSPLMGMGMAIPVGEKDHSDHCGTKTGLVMHRTADRSLKINEPSISKKYRYTVGCRSLNSIPFHWCWLQ